MSTATVTITVNSVDDFPLAVGEQYSGDEDTPIFGNVSTNDTLSGDGGNVWAVSTQAAHGVAVMNMNGTFTYTPNTDFYGEDSFTYTLTDGDGDVSTATVNITVVPVNDDPVAVPDQYSTDEDTPLVISIPGILGNDIDVDGDGLNVTFIAPPGTQHGELIVNQDGSFTYIPGENFNGTDSFIYVMNDGFGNSNPAKVTITVNPVNDPPVVTGEAVAAITLTQIDNSFNLAQDAEELINTLNEGQVLNSQLVVNDLGLIRIPNDQTITLYFQNEGAGYLNSIGWYKVSADGTITDVRMIWENASIPPLTPDNDGSNGYLDGSQATIQVQEGDMIGFFLAPNAFSKNNFSNFDLANGHFAFLSSDGTELANVQDGAPKLYFVSDSNPSSPIVVNTEAGAGVAWHSAAVENDPDFGDISGLNADDATLPSGHVFSASTDEGLALIGFEDLKGGGDKDYNDVTFFVDLGPNYINSITQLVDVHIQDPDNDPLGVDPIAKATITLESNGSDKLSIDPVLLALLNAHNLNVIGNDSKFMIIEGEENGAVSYLDFLDTYLAPNQGGLFVDLAKDSNSLPVSDAITLKYQVTDSQGNLSNEFIKTIPIALEAI